MLRGMKKILAKERVKIICEVYPSEMASLGYSIAEIPEFLSLYNYKIFLIDKSRRLNAVDDLLDVRAHYLFISEEGLRNARQKFGRVSRSVKFIEELVCSKRKEKLYEGCLWEKE